MSIFEEISSIDEEITGLESEISDLKKEKGEAIKMVSAYLKRHLPKSIKPDIIEVETNSKEESITIYVLGGILHIKVYKHEPDPEISVELLGYYKDIFKIIKKTKYELFD